MVYGSRFMGGAPHRVLYFWHSVGNWVLTLLSNCLTNINLSDMETCYKVFHREVIQAISLEEDRFRSCRRTVLGELRRWSRDQILDAAESPPPLGLVLLFSRDQQWVVTA